MQSLTVSHCTDGLHLDNTYMTYCPFCSSRFDVRVCVCNPNALFNRLIRNTSHRSTQFITSKLCIFNKNSHKTCTVVTQNERHPSTTLHNPKTTWAREVTWPLKKNISSSARSTATKLGRVVACDEGNRPMMSHDPLIMWSRVVTWQVKSLISPIPQSL